MGSPPPEPSDDARNRRTLPDDPCSLSERSPCITLVVVRPELAHPFFSLSASRLKPPIFCEHARAPLYVYRVSDGPTGGQKMLETPKAWRLDLPAAAGA